MNPSTMQARAVVDELIRGGVHEAVLCPGSRSAPLAFALADADADAAGRLRLHVRVDERSAGFLALGLARVTGDPVPVVVTSGTAVANLHPAMIEATHSRIPLIALTANRPPELRGVGASQTIDQVGIFGAHARGVFDVGSAGTASAADETRWRSLIRRALAATAAGPVQIDVPLREPLVPTAGSGPAPGVPSRGGVAVPEAASGAATGGAVLPVDLSVPTLVVAGTAPNARTAAFVSPIPTVAEPGAAATGPRVSPLAVPHLRPGRVIVHGRPTLHRSVAALLADPEVEVIVVAPGDDIMEGTWADVAGTADAVVPALDPVGGHPEGWTARCADVTAAADRAVAESLAATIATGAAPTGLHVAAAVADAVGAAMRAAPGVDPLLVVGASNPVRDLSLVPMPDPAVIANRGAAGIDGTVSTAIGAALAHDGPTIALLGDLTFLHDANGLSIGPGEPRPQNLTIVVANDGGGGIFSLLEQGAPEYADRFERIFGTPTATDIGALCAAHGVRHGRIDLRTLGGMLPETLAGTAAGGITVLEVTTDRGGLRDLHGNLRARIGMEIERAVDT